MVFTDIIILLLLLYAEVYYTLTIVDYSLWGYVSPTPPTHHV